MPQTPSERPATNEFDERLKEMEDRLNKKIDSVFEKIELEFGNLKAGIEESVEKKLEKSEKSMSDKIEKSEASMSEKIEKSEKSMTEKIEKSEKSITEKIEKSEKSMTEKIEKSEENLSQKIDAYGHFLEKNTKSQVDGLNRNFIIVGVAISLAIAVVLINNTLISQRDSDKSNSSLTPQPAKVCAEVYTLHDDTLRCLRWEGEDYKITVD